MRCLEYDVRARRLEVSRELSGARDLSVGAGIILLTLRGQLDLHILVVQRVEDGLLDGDGLL